MRQIGKWAVLGLLVAMPAVAVAAQVVSGQYTFTVRVENRHFKEIYDARIYVSVTGTQARITAEAPGYQQGYTYVYLNSTQTHYSTRMRLEDARVDIRVRDAENQYLSVYVDTNQFMAQANEYRFEVRLQAEGFTQFTKYDLDLRVNHMFPFGERVWVYNSGTYRVVEVTLRRRDLDRMFNYVDLRIPSDEQLESHRRNLARAIRFELQNRENLAPAHRRALLKRIER